MKFLKLKIKNVVNVGVALAIVFLLIPFVVYGSVEGGGTTNQVSSQVKDLKDSLTKLEQVRGSEKNSFNIEKEKQVRQMALFKIIEICLAENNQMLETVLRLKDLDKDILTNTMKSLEADNKEYMVFINRVNLAYSPEILKEIAKDIKDYRQNKDGLATRRLLGMVFSLQELKLVQSANEQLNSLYAVLNATEDKKMKEDLNFYLISARKELDTAYQLAKSSQMRLENLENFEDFSFVSDWLKRANDSINLTHQIFKSFTEKQKGVF